MGSRWFSVLVVAGISAAAAAAPAQGADPLGLKRLEIVPSGQRTPVEGLPGRARLAPPLLVPHPQRLRRAKERAARDLERAPAARGNGREMAPLAAVFADLNEPGLEAGDSSPPDTTGAIGPSHYLEMVNREIGVFARADLSEVAATDLNAFTDAPVSDDVFDPQIQWDPVANRWLYVADDIEAPGSNFLAVGWSRTADPTPFGAAGWCQFFIDTGDLFHDYPKLGHNDNHVIIGTNVFDDGGGPTQDDFLGSAVLAVSKPAAGDTSCAPPTLDLVAGPLFTADGDVAFTPVPANTFGPAANGYVVAADDPFFVAPDPAAQLMVWHVTPAATLVPDGNVGVTAFDIPAAVPQPGVLSSTLDSLDARLTQAVARTDPNAGGALTVWTQHTVDGPGGRAVARWYQLRPGLCGGGACPAGARRQEGTVADASHFVFNAAISPAAGGAAAINYNRGSGTLLAEIRARSRQGIDAPGSMTDEVLLGESAARNQDFTCTPSGVPFPCRWGDYAGASPDPVNPALVWGSNQLNGPVDDALDDDPNWITRNFALVADTVAPQTTIVSGPPQGGVTNDPTPTFTFSANEPGSTFACAVSAPLSACSGPGASHTTPVLADGAYVFGVAATDPSGNADPTAALRGFSIDTAAPATTITKGPPKRVRTRRPRAGARFRFESEAGAELECRVDRRAWKPCSSPQRVRVRAKRKPKRHAFRARATDAAGNTGKPASHRWTVIRRG